MQYAGAHRHDYGHLHGQADIHATPHADAKTLLWGLRVRLGQRTSCACSTSVAACVRTLSTTAIAAERRKDDWLLQATRSGYISAWPGRVSAASARARPRQCAHGRVTLRGTATRTPGQRRNIVTPKRPTSANAELPSNRRGVQRARSTGVSAGLPRLRVVAPDAAQQAVDEAANVLLRRVDARDHLPRAVPPSPPLAALEGMQCRLLRSMLVQNVRAAGNASAPRHAGRVTVAHCSTGKGAC